MNASSDRRLIEGGTPESPTVFVRTLSMPPGAPWDQARAAALEARIGAPLPLTDVVYLLRRLDNWRPGRPARYAACYVRVQDASETFETTVQIDGRSISIRFQSEAERNRRAWRVGAAITATVLPTMLLGMAIGSALSIRGETIKRLATIEERTEVELRQAEAQAQLQREARLLDLAGVKHQSLADFLRDVAWTASAKAPGAHIDALHWEHGYIGVEARGDVAPVLAGDRAVLKAGSPLRQGVWLWGVGPAGSASPSMPGSGKQAP